MDEISEINPRINMSGISTAACIITTTCACSPRTCTCHHLAPLGGLCCQLVGDVDHLLLLLNGDLLFVLVVWAKSQTRQHVLHAGGHIRRRNVELCNKCVTIV